MRIWIDAAQPDWELRVFHMTLVERHLRSIAMVEYQLRGLEQVEKKMGDLIVAESQLRSVVETALRPTEVAISLPAGAPTPQSIPEDAVRSLPVRWVAESGSVRERLQRYAKEADGEPVIALAGNTVVDTRVYEHLAWWKGGSVAFIGGQGEEAAAALRLDAPLPEAEADSDVDEELLDLARAETERGALKTISGDDLAGYVRKLRKQLKPYIFRIHDDADRQRVERFLFHSNYKGSTDFLTKYAYPPLVWRILQPLTRHRVHPNLVTSVGIFLTFAAVPLFAAGTAVSWTLGLLAAYGMSVLDSVDGKLARVTYRSSDQGDILDHGLDIIHPPFWYWAWGWGLSGGDPFSGVFIASVWMSVFYIFDRVMEMLFRSATGHSIHGFRPIDERMRTFISRRNVNLAIFTVALPLGLAVPAFYFIVGWQAFTLLFHLSRVVLYWNDRESEYKKSRS